MGTVVPVPAGTTFGRWAVIDEAPLTSARGGRALLCRCECGTVKAVRLGALRQGRTTSCGCAQREGVRLDVPPGTVFGHLTVIEEAARAGAQNVRTMRCLCECGREVIARLGALRSGATQACGCRRFGKAADPSLFKPGEVPLYGQKARGRAALVDEADFDLVMQYRWHAVDGQVIRQSTTYAATSALRDSAGKQVTTRMHTLITGWPLVDHVDGNGLNNQRSNLRDATYAQNAANRRPSPGYSSQFKGVRWYPQLRKWNARIGHAGKLRHLGYFEDEIDAAKAYDSAARALFGEYARPNFPDGQAA